MCFVYYFCTQIFAKTTARAIQHAQPPQRVHRRSRKFAQRHSESDSTRTISAEGSSASFDIRTAPHIESQFDTHNLRRGFVGELCKFARRHPMNPSRQLESPAEKVNLHGNSHFAAVSEFLIDLQNKLFTATATATTKRHGNKNGNGNGNGNFWK